MCDKCKNEHNFYPFPGETDPYDDCEEGDDAMKKYFVKTFTEMIKVVDAMDIKADEIIGVVNTVEEVDGNTPLATKCLQEAQKIKLDCAYLRGMMNAVQELHAA